MRYYEVLVASMSFHGREPLTYSSAERLDAGEIVKLPLRNKQVLGIIKSETSRPTFAAKQLAGRVTGDVKLPIQLLDLAIWLMSYYPAPSGPTVSMLLPQNIDQDSRIKKKNKELNAIVASKLPPLTKEQLKIVKELDAGKQEPVMIHGDTGSGKTRVYIEQAKKTIENGRSVLILTPEIGLTTQLLNVVASEFPDQTIEMHSKLTPAQKRDKWRYIASCSKPLIIVGPRSALFSPIKNLGLIVIDEAHDSAYKQDAAPYYQTTRVAAKLSQLHSASLILGTATPNISDYYTFKSKGRPILRMSELALNHPSKTDISLINIKDRDNFKSSPWISNKLLDNITTALNNNTQSLVFLNRRGSARAVLCQNCAWQALCPKCDIPLTYHQDKHQVICHTCGYKEMAPSSCPECRSTQIEFKVVGTKAIVQELERLFSNARISRFDSDNIISESLNKKHASVISGNTDILVGTQLITKGLDLPNLSVVGVVSADTALSFPDYTAEEITYQQLSQVMGRVGRGHGEGSVVIQTYYPDNLALKSAVTKNYSLFYEQQIKEREKFLFPPFCFVLKLTCVRKTSASAQKSMQKLHQWLASLPLAIDISQPAPAFSQKQNNSYRWQVIVKSKKRVYLTTIVNELPVKCSYDLDPVNLL